MTWRLWAEKLWRTCIYRGFLVDRYLSLSSIIAIIELTISPLSYRFIYVPNSCLLTLIISNSTITLFSIIFNLLPFETLLPSMLASSCRYISIPIKSDCWKHQTVQGHISHPPRQHPLMHQYQYQIVQDHITHPPRQQYQYQTVQDHITHPPRQQPPTQHSQTLPYQFRSAHGHISTPVTTSSEILQQRKRHRNPSPQSGRK